MNPRTSFPTGITFVAMLALMFAFGSSGAQEKAASAPKVRHVDAKEAAKLVATNAVVVLDIRTPDEFAEGHIAGATNIDFLSEDFSEKVAKLDRQKKYLVHCASGRRSANALPVLSKLNFTNVIHLDGGFSAWEEAKNPVTKK
jgi:rhodanese-related sulfurtransferase